MASEIKNKFAAFIINLLSKTWRIKINGEFPGKPAIIAFWHGFMLPAWKVFEDKGPFGVVSLSKDGQLLSSLLTKWGFRLIRGSSSKGGKEVLGEILAAAGNNYVLITPDGPHGPRYQMKAGAVVASHKSGVPLYLCGIKIKNAKTFKKSWDHFVLPLPFSSIEINFSHSLKIPEKASRNEIENFIEECTQKLNNLYI